jgi:organic hydroperoxide reductase OsmC/OhrA
MKTHEYRLHVKWTGNQGEGTKSYQGYSRNHEIHAQGKPILCGSSDPSFRGDFTKYNPEELFLSAISTCHMLWFLHLCSDSGIVVLSYSDLPLGLMEEDGQNGGRFIRVELNPMVTIEETTRIPELKDIHAVASQKCFIANSCNFPILCNSK